MCKTHAQIPNKKTSIVATFVAVFCLPALASNEFLPLAVLQITANSMTEKFSQEIPAALQPVATDNCSPVPRLSREPSQTAGVPEGPVWLSLAGPALFMNGQNSL